MAAPFYTFDDTEHEIADTAVAPEIPDITMPLHRRQSDPALEAAVQRRDQGIVAGQIANAQRAQAQAQTQRRVENRIRAKDLAERGIAHYTDMRRGVVKPITDSMGEPLTGYDANNSVAYDSTGNAKKIQFHGFDGPPELQDPYADAPRKTLKTGDVMSAPKGLPWRWEGTDEPTAQKFHGEQVAKLNSQTAAALSPVIADEHAQLSVAQKAAKETRKALAAAVPFTDAEGNDIDPDALDGPSLKKHIEDSFNTQYADPAANEKAWWGNGRYSPAAAAMRQRIDQEKAQANALADRHIENIGMARNAQSAVETLKAQQRELQSGRMDYINAKRAALGLEPVQTQFQSQDGQGGKSSGPYPEVAGSTPAPATTLSGAPAHDVQRDAAIGSGYYPHETGGAPENTPDETPFSPDEPALRIKPDGTTSIDPNRIAQGLVLAYKQGLIDEPTMKRLVPEAQKAQSAVKEQGALLADEGVASKLKALGYGAGKGAAFLAAAPIGAEAGAALGALGGPAAPVTVPLGAAIGGLVTGGVASFAADKALRALAKHSETIKGFTDSADLHPYYDAAGNLIAFGSGLPKTIANLGKDAAIRAASGASKATIAKALGTRVGGYAAGSVAIDTAIKEGAHALGLSEDHQTLGGAAQAAAIGAFISGHGIKINGVTSEQIANAAIKARLNQPMTTGEQEIANAFASQVTKLRSEGGVSQEPSPAELTDLVKRSTGMQATTSGKPYGVTSVEIAPEPPASPSPQPPPVPQLPRVPGKAPSPKTPAPSPGAPIPPETSSQTAVVESPESRAKLSGTALPVITTGQAGAQPQSEEKEAVAARKEIISLMTEREDLLTGPLSEESDARLSEIDARLAQLSETAGKPGEPARKAPLPTETAPSTRSKTGQPAAPEPGVLRQPAEPVGSSTGVVSTETASGKPPVTNVSASTSAVQPPPEAQSPPVTSHQASPGAPDRGQPPEAQAGKAEQPLREPQPQSVQSQGEITALPELGSSEESAAYGQANPGKAAELRAEYEKRKAVADKAKGSSLQSYIDLSTKAQLYREAAEEAENTNHGKTQSVPAVSQAESGVRLPQVTKPLSGAESTAREAMPADSTAVATESPAPATTETGEQTNAISEQPAAEMGAYEGGSESARRPGEGGRVGQRQQGAEAASESQQQKAPDVPVQVTPVDEAAHEAATSPHNGLSEPSRAQKEAGNYKKGTVRIAGMEISIENPAGSKRRPEWPELKSHYGYVKGSVGKDKDHVDVFIRPGAPEDYSGPVFVVNQNGASGSFDEHKAVIGASNEADARALYLENYTPDQASRIHSIAEMPMDYFKKWVRGAGKTKPAKSHAVSDSNKDVSGAEQLTQEQVQPAGSELNKPERTVADYAADYANKIPATKKEKTLAKGRLNGVVSPNDKARLEHFGGLQFREDVSPLPFVTTDAGIFVNLDGVSKALRAFDTDEAKNFYVAKAIAEEINHAAAFKALTREELANVGKNLSTDERSAIEELRGYKHTDEEAGAEAIRVFMQLREGGEPTEAFRLFEKKARVDTEYRSAIRKVLDYLKKLATELSDKLSKPLREGIARVEAYFRGIESGTQELRKGQVNEYGYPTKGVGEGYHQVPPGERIRVGDERKDGMGKGGWEQVPKGVVGRRADESQTIRRKGEAPPQPSHPANDLTSRIKLSSPEQPARTTEANQQSQPPGGGNIQSGKRKAESGKLPAIAADTKKQFNKLSKGLFAATPEFQHGREKLSLEDAQEAIETFDKDEPETWPKDLQAGEPVKPDRAEPDSWAWALSPNESQFIDDNEGGLTFADGRWKLADGTEPDEIDDGAEVRFTQLYRKALVEWDSRQREAVERMESLEKQISESRFLYAAVPGNQTDTPEFKRWFGNSKVVDADGEPLVLYHGTASTSITEFMPRGFGKDESARLLEQFRTVKGENGRFGYMNFRGGTFFSPKADYAGRYGGESGSAVMYPVFIRAENPVYFDQETKAISGGDASRTPDALIMHTGGDINEVAVIDPTQIKSAIGNSGAFDPKNPSILAAAVPDASKQIGFPKEKIGEAVKLAHLLIRDGVDTPAKLGAFLEQMSAGKARPYSKALWMMLRSVNPELNEGPKDWSTVYESGTQESGKPEGAAPTAEPAEQIAAIAASQKAQNDAERPAGAPDTSPAKLKVQKAYLLGALDKAIEGAPEVEGIEYGRKPSAYETPETEAERIIDNDRAAKRNQDKFGVVEIEVPGDGVFRILNAKQALRDFRDLAKKKFPTATPKPDRIGGNLREEPTKIAEVGKPKGAGDVIRIAAIARSTDETRYVLNYVMSDGKQVIATDGRRLALVSVKAGGTEKQPVYFDKDAKVYKPPATYKDDKGKEQKASFNYPNWQQVVPKSEEQHEIATLDTAATLKLLIQAKEMVSDKSNSVRLWMDNKGNLGVTSNTPDIGEYSGGDANPEKAQFIAAYNPEFLADAMRMARALGHEKVIWKGTITPATQYVIAAGTDMNPATFEAKGFKYVLMPMRGEGSSTHPLATSSEATLKPKETPEPKVAWMHGKKPDAQPDKVKTIIDMIDAKEPIPEGYATGLSEKTTARMNEAGYTFNQQSGNWEVAAPEAVEQKHDHFKELTRRITERQEELRRFAHEHDGATIEVKATKLAPSREARTIISPSAKIPGKFQATVIDKDGPSSDVTFSSLADALVDTDKYYGADIATARIKKPSESAFVEAEQFPLIETGRSKAPEVHRIQRAIAKLQEAMDEGRGDADRQQKQIDALTERLAKIVPKGEPPVVQMGQGEPAKPASPAKAERLDRPEEEKPVTDIQDFGEHIPHARKETARPLGPKGQRETPTAETSEQPAWRRKYEVVPETTKSHQYFPTKGEGQPTGKFIVRRVDTGKTFQNSYATREEAEAAPPLVEVARNHGVSYRRTAGNNEEWHIYRKVGEHKRPVVKGGFASEQDAMKYMATHAIEIIEHKFQFPERPWLDRLERVGGKQFSGNVTPQMFQDTFAFRGGQFGNWNLGGDGQAALNHAYGALLDLADILGVEPKALSLHGELAIAFGARGTGGENAAAAHYEPGYRVINLTKIKGAGSLAHEWFHALDHYLGRQDGKAKDRIEEAKASGRDLAYVRGEYVSHGISHKSGLREELRKAFKRVIDTMTAKQVEVEVPAEKLKEIEASQQKYVRVVLDELRQSFTTGHQYTRKKTPASQEQIAAFDKLADKIAAGDVGEKIYIPPKGAVRGYSMGHESYQSIQDLNALYKSVLGRSFDTNDEHSRGKSLMWKIRSMKDAQARVAAAGEKAIEKRNVATAFLKNAREIDYLRASSYWAEPHEMGARSFESFVSDKLAQSERQNDYLVHGTDNKLYALLGLKPYPEGDERTALHEVWQSLWDTIQQRKTEKGVALYAATPEQFSKGDRVTLRNGKQGQIAATGKGGKVAVRLDEGGVVMQKISALQKAESRKQRAEPLHAAVPFYDKAADLVSAAKEEGKSRTARTDVAAKFDAVSTIANYHGEQAADSIRLDYPKESDREAMPFVIEAGGDASKLQTFKTQIAASSDPKLAKKYGPVIDHAIADFARLDAFKGNHDKMMANSLAEVRAAGIDLGEVENYVTRKLDAPDAVKDLLPNPLFGQQGGTGNSPRYFTKGRSFETLADAIQAGYRPKSTDLAELDGHRIAAAKRLVEQRKFFNELRATPSPTDGKPIIGKLETRHLVNGDTEQTVPRGYTVVNAAGQPLPIHDHFAGVFKALYGQSALRNSLIGRGLIKMAAVAKHGTLVLDTFHVGRLLYKMATAGGGSPVTMRNGKPAWNIHKGLSVLEYADADLDRAVTAGDITSEERAYARAMRPDAEDLMKAGLNIGRVADNLMQQARVHWPVIGDFNDWIFGKLSRGAMLQTALTAFQKNLKKPGTTREQALRQTAKECNEIFGNLQNQGLFKSKTMQDIARLIFLAPQWTESQFRYEARAYGQAGKSAFNAARGKGLQFGTATRAFAVGFAALLLVNQIINYLTRGKSTFENDEEGHKLDAWLPGGKRGFWFNPMEIAGEYAFRAYEYLARHEHPVDVASHIASNKLSPFGRATKEALTGRDYAGRKFLSDTDRFRSAATDALPFPMPLNSVLERDPRQPLGFRVTRQPAAPEKQLLQSIGMKLVPAASARTLMFALAKPFRADRGTSDAAGEYTELRRALDNDNLDAAEREVRWLLNRGKSMELIERAAGIHKDGTIHPEMFTGSAEREKEMLATLSAENKAVYQQAQQDHKANALKLKRLLAQRRITAVRTITPQTAPARKPMFSFAQ